METLTQVALMTAFSAMGYWYYKTTQVIEIIITRLDGHAQRLDNIYRLQQQIQAEVRNLHLNVVKPTPKEDEPV